jgi:serine/threonine-protein kinase
VGGDSFRKFLPTRDGQHFVVTNPDGQLAVRSRDAEDFRILAGTSGGYYPFESPDGRDIGFLLSSGNVGIVPLDGGPVRILADSGTGVWGATRSEDGYVYLSSNAPTNIGIVRVRAAGTAAGGVLEAVTSVTGSGITGHIFPIALPDARGILFTVQPGTNARDAMIAVTRPGTGEHRELIRGLSARYSTTGHLLVLTADGSLVAAPFDLDKLEVTGDPVPVLQGLVPPRAYGADGEYHLTDDGTLWYERGERAQDLQPVWVTRTGDETPVRRDWKGSIGPLAISPDGRRIAYSQIDGEQERLWVARTDGAGAPTLLEREGNINFRPSWSPDGRSLAWISNRAGGNAAFTRAVDGQATARALLPASVQSGVWEVAYPRSGPWVLFRVEGNASDIFAFRPGVDSVARSLRATPAVERQPALSPDGRWLAYISNEDGTSNIYVRPFPNVDDAVWQVTTNGGLSPKWSLDGRELFYTSSSGVTDSRVNGHMMVAPVVAGEGFAWGTPRQLFAMAPYVDADNSFLWDISPSDGRFLMLRRLASGAQPKLVMVENFPTELRARLKR